MFVQLFRHNNKLVFLAPGVTIFVQILSRNHIDIVFFSAPGVAFPERLLGYIKTSICLKLNLGNM